MKSIALENNQVPAQLRGNYSGRKFWAHVTESVTVYSHDGLWDSGSRTTKTLINLETGESVPASDNMSAPWDNRQNRTITLKPGFAVIEHRIFLGKDMGLTFHVHPDNATKRLPAPAPELPKLESLVLKYTIEKKASYNGRDRYDMAKDDHRFNSHYHAIDAIADPFPTREQWNAAKDSLISKGLLNKAGAVTVKGRNARA